MANNNLALTPKIWAQEGLMFLSNNMIMGNLVNRQFSNDIAKFGDAVNTYRPVGFKGIRKTDDDEITLQNADTTSIQTKLDQHFHVSFIIKDGEETTSIKDLRKLHIEPAFIAISDAIDQVLLGQMYNFTGNSAGQLNVAPDKNTLVDLRKVLNANKVPVRGRNLVVGSTNEAALLKDDSFTSAEKVGDEGTALREGSLGRKLGFNIFMDQNTPEIVKDGLTTASTTTSGAEIAGATVIGLASVASANVGDYIDIAGDGTVQVITAVGGADVTISPGLKRATPSGAAVTLYTGTLIDNVGGYAANWVKDLVTDASPKQYGQLIKLANGEIFSAIGTPTSTSMTLNRSLASAVADNSIVGLGPAGNFGFGFNENAIALVSRPLAAPASGAGVQSAVVNFNGLSIRSTIGYDIKAQGHIVTLDLLMGTSVLDTNLGAVLLG